MQVFKEFHSQNVVLRSLNATFLVLILNKGGASDVNNFKPINLVGSLHKILAKVLTNRLKRVIGKVVSNNQNALVRARQILDATLAPNEAINSRKRSSNAVGGMEDVDRAATLFGCKVEKLPASYLGGGGGWTTREVRDSYGLSLWKDIRKGWEEFILGTSIRIGNGLHPTNMLQWQAYERGKGMEAVVGRCIFRRSFQD
ncbi:hypothetical protein CK203_025116 [Vitis vinifera]|uniref:Uncharacterized protein n=1 Tax=Vitis vinifera TaxID=29760 RepID=A0A438JEY0_VITVI|nr:hypothetical protein CK203_025116 [Vitis vinifera]